MILLPKTDRLTLEPPAPGIYPDVPAPTYFAWRAASKSLLKEVIDAPTDAHIMDSLTSERPMTAALADGAAYDCLLFEPERFEREYVIVPKMTRKGKEWDAVLARAGGRADRVIWQEDDVDNPQRLDAVTLRAMHTAIRNEARFRSALACPGGKVQLSLVWVDPATGLACKGRIDRLLPNNVILDAKTALTAERVAFGRQCIDSGYDIQAFAYPEGYRILTGIDTEFFFLVQEKHGKFRSALYNAHSDLMEPSLAEVGRARFRASMGKLANAIQLDTWAGYPTVEQPIPVPVYAAREWIPNLAAAG